MKPFDKQLTTFAYIRLVNKPCENEVVLREQNISLKCFQPLELLMYFGRVVRSLQKSNIGSVGKRAVSYELSKWDFSRKSLPLWPLEPKIAQRVSFRIQVRLGSNHSQRLTDKKIAVL